MSAHPMLMAGTLFSFLVMTHLHAVEPHSYWPEPNPGEAVVLLVTPKQVSSLISIRNFETPETRSGVCFGIDRLNYALLTRVHFSNALRKQDSLAAISAKLTAATMGEQPLTIHGYGTLVEFVDEMEKLDDGENPLRACIIAVQQTQLESFSLSPGAIKALVVDAERREQALKLQAGIDAKIPQSLSIADDEGRHSLTVVGYRRYQGSLHAHEFFALDANHPRTLQRLSLERDAERSALRWFYYPWEKAQVVKIPVAPPTENRARNLPLRRYTDFYYGLVYGGYGANFYPYWAPTYYHGAGLYYSPSYRVSPPAVMGGEVVIQIHTPTERIERISREVLRRSAIGYAETNPRFAPIMGP